MRRPSATNQKSMVPSSATMTPAMPVSSCDLTDGCLLGGLTGLDVALGQRPEQASLPIGASDQRTARDFAGEVENEPAGTEFVDLAQPATWLAPGRTAARFAVPGHGPMITARARSAKG